MIKVITLCGFGLMLVILKTALAVGDVKCTDAFAVNKPIADGMLALHLRRSNECHRRHQAGL